MRINRYLAGCGLGSRRACEQLVREGRVRVNGTPCTDLSTVIGESDLVTVRGRRVHPQRTVWIAINKPKGLVTTSRDEHGRKTVFSLLPPGYPQLHHVGRLDKDSEGLLLLTNDGELAAKLTHPRNHVEKEYLVGLDRDFDNAHASVFLRGVRIEGGVGKFKRVTSMGGKRVRVVLDQGMKRQIRLMFAVFGYRVTKLKRIRIGNLKLGTLPSGRFRELGAPEARRIAGH